jgi:hypothetical protein
MRLIGANNRQSQLKRLKKVLREEIMESSCLNASVQAAQILGYINWKAFDDKYSDEKIESLLFALYNRKSIQPNRLRERLDWLHIVSSVGERGGGGHSQLLLNLIHELAKRNTKQGIFITRKASPWFVTKANDAGVKVFCHNKNDCAWISDLVDIGSSASTVTLSIHPDDIGASIAARALRSKGSKVVFVNHADHAFSYGTGSADIILEISGYGWNITREYRQFNEQSYLGIPFISDNIGASSTKANKIICVGSSHKFEPVAGISFPAFLADLVKSCNLPIELVGPTGMEKWWTGYLRQYSERVTFHGPLSPAKTQALIKASSVYVDSFPIPGGTAFTQALMSGCTVFGICHSSGGYSMADALRYDSTSEMLNGIVNRAKLGYEPVAQCIMREQVEKYHAVSAVVDRLIKASKGEPVPLPARLEKAGKLLNNDAFVLNNPNNFHFNFGEATELRFLTRMRVSIILVLSSDLRGLITLIPKCLFWCLVGKLF